ncbi:MAG: peptidoglycan bridge formation glycyltransferase FemA/FemB family protein [Candidatus Peribacteraceae bacterium]|nr:peptidoglycan bridge formation glycyltransferase FemA/FemB family protein [Candidatus Peribacteraceae bacterium]
MTQISIAHAVNKEEWDSFLLTQPFSPFLQSWTMGEVYKEVGQEPIRLTIRDDNKLVGICFGHVVNARRGRHISVPYGPVLGSSLQPQVTEVMELLITQLRLIALSHKCHFLRISPFWTMDEGHVQHEHERWMTHHAIGQYKAHASPMHLLAEHLWVLNLKDRSTDDILKDMRKTTRNLIRRAEKDGVTIEASTNPNEDLVHFLRLHDETRHRHGFTPYTNAFFQAQVKRFAAENACTLYLARFQGEVIAASIHMHMGGVTSYHHGASTQRFSKVPASYLLQWTAITDAMKRGDTLYNFWGIAPQSGKSQLPTANNQASLDDTKSEDQRAKSETVTKNDQTNNETTKKHPFAGVTLFKTGFGGSLVELVHCVDIPLHPWYTITRTVELLRKKRRGF